MQTLLVEIESSVKAKELSVILSSMNFVKKVSSINKKKELISALKEHEEIKTAIVKNKNKAFAKYL
jgi:hypothetical protein